MGSVPQKIDLETGADNWDAAAEANFDLLLKSPRPLFQHTGDETDLESTYPAAAWEQCSVWVDHTVLGRIIYWSNGTVWAPLHQPKSLGLRRWQWDDFCNVGGGGGAAHPFIGGALATGASIAVATANMMGAARMSSSANANSGYKYQTNDVGCFVAAEGLAFAAIFQFTIITNTLQRFGFLDTVTHADAADGAYFELASGVVAAKTASNSTRTTSGTTWAPSTGVPYLATVRFGAAAADVRFRIVELDGTERYDQTIATNVPSGILRAFGAGFIATTTASAAAHHAMLDGMGFGLALPVEFEL